MVREARFTWDGADGIDQLDWHTRFDEFDDEILDPFTPTPSRAVSKNASRRRRDRRTPTRAAEAGHRGHLSQTDGCDRGRRGPERRRG